MAELEKRLAHTWSLDADELTRLSLGEAVAKIEGESESSSIRSRDSEASELGADVLKELARTDATVLEQLPQSAEALQSLLRLQPSRTSFSGTQFVRKNLESLCEALDGSQLEGVDMALAIDSNAIPTDLLPENAYEFLAHSMHRALLDRALQTVRRDYVDELGSALEGEYGKIFEALYTDDLEAFEDLGRNDSQTLRLLAQLLNRDGWLDQHRRRYLQLADKPEDVFTSLAPTEDSLSRAQRPSGGRSTTSSSICRRSYWARTTRSTT